MLASMCGPPTMSRGKLPNQSVPRSKKCGNFRLNTVLEQSTLSFSRRGQSNGYKFLTVSTRAMTRTQARDQASEPNPYTSPVTPPAISGSPRPAVSKHPKSGMQLIIAVVCCLWILSCTLWFCAAIYEVIRFTLLQDAYGPHTSVFRNAYLTSAAIAFLLGVPAAIVLFRIRLPYMRNQPNARSADKANAKAG